MTGADLAAGLDGRAVDMHPASLDGARRRSARLEQARRPEPIVDTHDGEITSSRFFTDPVCRSKGMDRGDG